MKTRPITLSNKDVCAILDGTKTQFKKLVGGCLARPHVGVLAALCGPDTDDIRFDAPSGEWYCEGGLWLARCPFGVVGDRLWVKETWAQPGTVARSDDPVRKDEKLVYRASSLQVASWRSPVTMPRWASRLTLTVTGVRIERIETTPTGDKWEWVVDFRKETPSTTLPLKGEGLSRKESCHLGPTGENS